MYTMEGLLFKATGISFPCQTVPVEMVERLQSLVSVVTGKLVDAEKKVAEQEELISNAARISWIVEAQKDELKVAESNTAREVADLDELRNKLKLELQLQNAAAADSAEVTNAESVQRKLCETVEQSNSVAAMQDAGTQTCMRTEEGDDLKRQVCQLQAQLAKSQRQHASILEQLSAERCKAEEMEKACGVMGELHKELEQQLAAERVSAKDQEKALSTAAEAHLQVDKIKKACAELTHKLELEVTTRLNNAKEFEKACSDVEELRGQLAFTKGELDREEKRKLSKAGDCVDLKKQCHKLERELQEVLEELAAAEDELEEADHMLLTASSQAARMEEWHARLTALSDAKHSFQSKHAAAVMAVARREAAIARQKGARALPMASELSAALAEVLAQWAALTEQQPACEQEPLSSVLSPPLSSDASSVSE